MEVLYLTGVNMRFKEFSESLADIEKDPSVQIYRMLTNPFSAGTDTGDSDAASSPGSPTRSAAKGVPSSFKPKKGAVSVNEISSYLSSKGLDRNQILGILANIQGESGFQPGILGDGNTSGGLFQHHGPRFSNMVNAVGSDWQTDWKGQIDFALSEPAGAKYARISFRTPEAATEWWTRNFEVPKYADADVRKRVGFLSQLA